MDWLTISVVLNLALAALAILYAITYNRLIRDAKLSTFCSVLKALSYSVAVNDNDTRYNRLAFALRDMLGNVDVDQIELYVKQSSLFGYLGSGKEPAIIDVLTERDRLNTIRLAARHGLNDVAFDDMWRHIEKALSLEYGYIEPSDQYTYEEFKKGQAISESQLIDLYDLALRNRS